MSIATDRRVALCSLYVQSECRIDSCYSHADDDDRSLSHMNITAVSLPHNVLYVSFVGQITRTISGPKLSECTIHQNAQTRNR